MFNFSAGNTQTLDLTVEDTTPANSTISPTSATFDLYTGDATLNAAIPVTVTLNGNTLSSIVNGSYTLVSGTDYTVTNSGGTVTINMSYLSTLAVSTYSLVFNFSAGNTQTLDLTVEDTTPANSTISPTSATFDLYTGDATLNAAIPVTVTLNGNTLSSIVNGSYTLVSGTDYTVTNSGGTVTINMSYLSTLAVSTYSLVFNFSAGNTQTLALTVENTTTYTVTYNANSTTATGNVPVDSSSPYASGAPVTVLGNVGTPAPLANAGYTFGGWSLSTTGAAITSFTMPASNTTLYAVWTANTPAPGGGGGGGPAVPVVTSVNLNTGSTAGGTSVTISGNNLTGATVVDFGTTPATSFTVNTNGTITAIVPAEAAGTVDVFVTTPVGASGVNAPADQFTYTAPVPAPIPVKGAIFTDVPSTFWAYGDIENLSGLGYVSGYPDGTFKPSNQITRAEFCAIMDKVLNLTTSTQQTPTFTDVNTGDWFYQAVEDGCLRRDCQGIRRRHVPSECTDFQAGDRLRPDSGAGQVSVG